jgi:hypothetical protein
LNATGKSSSHDLRKLIDDQLTHERNVRASLESRAVAVVTTSGTLVTLLLALAATVTKPPDFRLSASAAIFILASLVVFIASAVLAIVAIGPRKHVAISEKDLEEWVEKSWDSSEDLQGPNLALASIGLIRGTREINQHKGHILLLAILAQILAVLLLALAVATILLTQLSA